MGSSWGRAFRVTTFGESHGGGLGVVIDGCPPGLALDLDRVQAELDRRRPGQSKLVTQRKETDTVEVLSGLFEGQTLGTSIGLVIRNKDADPRAYAPFKDRYRPSHADFTYDAKYGLRAWAGGGRASARETAARVAAGAVARQVLESLVPALEIVSWVDRIQDLQATVDAGAVTTTDVERTPVRCPDPAVAAAMIERIAAIRKQGDTIGGIVRAVARGVPAGLGEPVFDKLDADLAKAMLSLPAAKGFELGSGFAGTEWTGTQHNDVFVPDAERGVATQTNHSGGIQGGISNGMPITLAVAFKPVATVFTEQPTVNRAGEAVSVRPKGRHDPCVLPRAVPIVESMIALVLADHLLRWRGQVGTPPPIPVERG